MAAKSIMPRSQCTLQLHDSGVWTATDRGADILGPPCSVSPACVVPSPTTVVLRPLAISNKERGNGIMRKERERGEEEESEQPHGQF